MDNQEVFHPPVNMYAKMYAVKSATNYISKFHLIDIGLKGWDDKISLQNGTATFSHIKFTTTSFKNEVNLFFNFNL